MTTNEKDVLQYLTFSLAGEEYGVSVLAVREILEYGVVTRVPRAPSHFRGVINLRGRVVPLVDLALRLGLESRPLTPRTCVVVVEVDVEGDRVVVGLVVDAVSRVIEFGPADIEPSPSFGAAAEAGLIAGMGRAGKSFVLLLAVDSIVANTAIAATALTTASVVAPASGSLSLGGM